MSDTTSAMPFITSDKTMSLFEFKSDKSVRCTIVNGKPRFAVKDVTNILGYVNSNDAVIRHCRGEILYIQVTTNGGNRNMRFITESDLYRLVMRSNMDEAEAFQDWIVDEVLPCIRKTGMYATDSTIAELQRNPDSIHKLLEDVKMHKKAVQQKERELLDYRHKYKNKEYEVYRAKLEKNVELRRMCGRYESQVADLKEQVRRLKSTSKKSSKKCADKYDSNGKYCGDSNDGNDDDDDIRRGSLTDMIHIFDDFLTLTYCRVPQNQRIKVSLLDMIVDYGHYLYCNNYYHEKTSQNELCFMLDRLGFTYDDKYAYGMIAYPTD